jgi:HSP20 family protein
MAAEVWSPFDALLQFQRALDRQRESDWFEDMTGGGGAFPPVNVFQQGDDLVAIIEVPGVKKDDLVVEAKANTIRIAGRKSVDYGSDAIVHRRERPVGSFDRTLTLPVDLDADRISAQFQDGILALLLPRAETDKPRAIKIG